MDNINKTVVELEKKINKLSRITFILGVLLCVSFFCNFFSVDLNSASAGPGYVIAPPNVVPAIEAQSFILKDAQGNIRGMWSADEHSTTFATSYRKKQPFISMNVNEDEAVLAISDDKNNQILLSSSDLNGQMLTMGNINSPSHNVLLGYNGDEVNFELLSIGASRIGMAGHDVLIEALGNKSDIVLAERRGNYINLSSSVAGSKMMFVDAADFENVKIESVNGESFVSLISPATKSKKIINTAK